METYGWRAYALPALLVLTLVVMLNMLPAPERPPNSAVASAPSPTSSTSPTGTPLATESPLSRVPLDSPTAALPAGGEYTHDGAGTWHIVEGTSEWVGTGEHRFTYTVEVEDGIAAWSYGGDKVFAQMVEATLADPRGWIAGGTVSFKRVDADGPPPDFRVRLTTPKTIEGPCGGPIDYEVSCYNPNWKKGGVFINLARWVRGAMAFNGDLLMYRHYAINHEIGHFLNNHHKGCPEDGALAPVMMQQTFGVANNFVSKLNGSDPNDFVPANGNVCRPNAWPNPMARPAD